MTTAAVEWDARPGPVRDAVRKAIGLWLRTLAHEVQIAVDAGELPAETIPGRGRIPAQRAGVGGELELPAHR